MFSARQISDLLQEPWKLAKIADHPIRKGRKQLLSALVFGIADPRDAAAPCKMEIGERIPHHRQRCPFQRILFGELSDDIRIGLGGIPLAMIAGRICGRVAAENVKSSSPLADYETQWREIMEKPLKTAAFNKKLADTFAFRSERSTRICMSILGQRRMGNLIRCKRIFP